MYPLYFQRLRMPLMAFALVAAYWVSDLISLFVTQNLDHLPSFFAADSFLVLGLLMLTGRWRALCAAGCLTGSLVLNLAHHVDLTLSASVTAASALTAGLSAWLIRRFRVAQARNLKQVGKLLAFVVAPVTALGAVILAGLLTARYHMPFAPVAMRWFMAALMGTSMVLPTLLLLTARGEERLVHRSRIELFVLGALALAMAGTAWSQAYMLPLILAFPIATLFALRLGGRATAISVLLITLIAFCYPFVHPDPKRFTEGADKTNAAILGFQIYIVFVFYNGLVTALATDHQARIKRQLERRTAIARAARARAQKASQAKTEFLAAMSHELRTPLNGVLGFTQLLLSRTTLDAESRREAQLIGKSGETLAALIGDILDYSAMERGAVILKPGPATPSSLAADVIEMTAMQARAKGLALTASVRGECDRAFLLDEARLRQVLLNLLGNAVKFTEAGEVCLRLAATNERLRFEVSDTGIGIDKARQAQLFDHFVQADVGRGRAYDGAGLGLSICRSLVELMDGRIGVVSEPGQGTLFWFEIPAQACETADRAVEAVEAETDEDAPVHVLVVDDHPVNRELATTMLGLLGCTSDQVENGAEAVEAVRVTRYDAVLMDVHMPVMDGLEATRAIRALAGRRGHVPIIGLSADVLGKSVEIGLAAGMDEYLGKPVNLAGLQTALARRLSEPDARAA